jgi:hypothetical protein
MLLQVLELPIELATITAIVLPIIAVCFFILAIPWLKNGSTSKLRKYLSYTITPPKLKAESSIDSNETSEQAPTSSVRNDRVKLYFYYLGIVLFLISFILAEFYQVMVDASFPVTQGNTGDSRIITTIFFQSLFNVGWVGSLPWFGVTAYHQTWNWVLFTSAFTDNPNFLASFVVVLTLLTIGVGIVFLVPLAIKSIRHSFVPAMFFFMTGMTIFTKAAVGYFGGAVHLLYASIEFDYSLIIATGSMIPNFTGVLTSCILLILPMFVLFVFLGRKLWKVFYDDSRSRNWFTVYIALSFWIGLLLTTVVM